MRSSLSLKSSDDQVNIEDGRGGNKITDPIPLDGKCHDLETTVNQLVLSTAVLQSKLDAMWPRLRRWPRKAGGGVPFSGCVTPDIQVTDATPTEREVDAVHEDLHRQNRFSRRSRSLCLLQR